MKIPSILVTVALLMNCVTALFAQEAVAKNCRPRTLVTFCVMGDVPYSDGDDGILPKQLEEIPQAAEFVIHVGDIKSGKTPCNEEVYIKVSCMLAKSPKPLFIIPGDNEWNDCTDPAPSWTYWKSTFLASIKNGSISSKHFGNSKEKRIFRLFKMKYCLLV